jgi:hypoxanthine-guanine phosphoribosyltransferase
VNCGAANGLGSMLGSGFTISMFVKTSVTDREMTLVGDLVDSESGQVIARVVDRREAQGTGMMTLTNSVVNRQEASIIAASWARILRKRLDAAHGIGRK